VPGALAKCPSVKTGQVLHVFRAVFAKVPSCKSLFWYSIRAGDAYIFMYLPLLYSGRFPAEPRPDILYKR